MRYSGWCGQVTFPHGPQGGCKGSELILDGPFLGGGFNFFYFHPYLGKIPILTSIFFRWVVQPPTSFVYWTMMNTGISCQCDMTMTMTCFGFCGFYFCEGCWLVFNIHCYIHVISSLYPLLYQFYWFFREIIFSALIRFCLPLHGMKFSPFESCITTIKVWWVGWFGSIEADISRDPNEFRKKHRKQKSMMSFNVLGRCNKK